VLQQMPGQLDSLLGYTVARHMIGDAAPVVTAQNVQAEVYARGSAGRGEDPARR
jgi:hypothetical protein